MTIAAVFRCQDAIVLCADREMTEASYAFKFAESKIYPIDSYGGKIVLTYAGNPDQAHSVALELAKRINRLNLSLTDILGVLNELPVDVPHRFKKTQYLIAISWNGELQALKSTDKEFLPVRAQVDFIGVGDTSLTRFLGEFLGGTPFSFIEARQAAICALYILRQAENFVPHVGCPTDVVIISREGQFVPFNVIEAESAMLLAAEEVRRVASMFTNPSVSAEEFKNALGDFNAKVTAARTELFKPGEVLHEHET